MFKFVEQFIKKIWHENCKSYLSDSLDWQSSPAPHWSDDWCQLPRVRGNSSPLDSRCCGRDPGNSDPSPSPRRGSLSPWGRPSYAPRRQSNCFPWQCLDRLVPAETSDPLFVCQSLHTCAGSQCHRRVQPGFWCHKQASQSRKRNNV